MTDKDLLQSSGHLDLGLLLRRFRWQIALTWMFVLVENLLIALLPLFIGRAIDALLDLQAGALWEISVIMTALIVVSVTRRIYDTRAYGSMRVWFGSALVSRNHAQDISRINARLNMGREMVDFLEEHVPEVMTAVVQVIVSISILWHFQTQLGINALAVIGVMMVVYALFHRRFYLLNSYLNEQHERQVSVLGLKKRSAVVDHLQRLRKGEVRLSDADALLYGAIFAAMFAFVLLNLWTAAQIPMATAGAIFTIVSYSWELVESGVSLPAALQQWTRLSEIRDRINESIATDSNRSCAAISNNPMSCKTAPGVNQ